jgi:hypothetical protein
MRSMRSLQCAVVALGMTTMALGALAGCGGSSSAQVAQTATATATATATLAQTATATATATVEPSVTTSFTCPAAVSGSQKVFSDTMLELRFSYPAAWTENVCTRTVLADGTESLVIGNLFRVITAPHNGLTIQQWVSQQTDTPNETVTLTPLTAPHAVAAVTVQAAPTANPTSNKPFDSEPFAQTDAIVAGTQQFYQVVGLIAEANGTDTAPPLSHDQLMQQVVTNFEVP